MDKKKLIREIEEIMEKDDYMPFEDFIKELEQKRRKRTKSL